MANANLTRCQSDLSFGSCTLKYLFRFSLKWPLGCTEFSMRLRYCRYRKRYWKKCYFDGIDKIKEQLDKSYGEGKVSMSEASLRWIKYHSALIPDGKLIVFFIQISAKTLLLADKIHNMCKQNKFHL